MTPHRDHEALDEDYNSALRSHHVEAQEIPLDGLQEIPGSSPILTSPFPDHTHGPHTINEQVLMGHAHPRKFDDALKDELKQQLLRAEGMG